MLAQMAATAGSVAVGSTIGHGLSSMLFGGGGGQAAPVEQQQPVLQQQQQGYQQGVSCEVQAKGAHCVSYKLKVIIFISWQILQNALRRRTCSPARTTLSN
jgi:hypothetical protein